MLTQNWLVTCESHLTELDDRSELLRMAVAALEDEENGLAVLQARCLIDAFLYELDYRTGELQEHLRNNGLWGAATSDEGEDTLPALTAPSEASQRVLSEKTGG